jgi:hypothetical protein
MMMQGTPKKKTAAATAAKSSPDKSAATATPKNVAAVSKALAAGVPAGENIFTNFPGVSHMSVMVPDQLYFPFRSLLRINICLIILV